VVYIYINMYAWLCIRMTKEQIKGNFYNLRRHIICYTIAVGWCVVWWVCIYVVVVATSTLFVLAPAANFCCSAVMLASWPSTLLLLLSLAWLLEGKAVVLVTKARQTTWIVMNPPETFELDLHYIS